MEEVKLLLFTFVNKESVISKRDIEVELLKRDWTLKTLNPPQNWGTWLALHRSPAKDLPQNVQGQLPGAVLGRKPPLVKCC